MKTLYLSVIVIAGLTLIIGSVVFFIFPLQNPSPEYLIIHTGNSKNSSSIQPCMSKQDTVFDPGPSGFAGVMCTVEPRTYVEMMSYSGFESVCHDKKYDADNYVLKAGHNGSITYKIHLDVPLSAIFMSPYVDMINHASFAHRNATDENGFGWYYTDTLKDVEVLFEPKSEMIWFWSPSTVTAKITTLPDANKDSHWLMLSPGVCRGGPTAILSVNASRIN